MKEAALKFQEMHNCDYDGYCHNRCDNQGLSVNDSIPDKFYKLSKVFTEFEYLGFYCHNYSNDYVFTPTDYCKMDSQFKKIDNNSYFMQNWSHGGIDENANNIINDILKN